MSVAGLTYFKYDGTVLRQSYLEDTNSIGSPLSLTLLILLVTIMVCDVSSIRLHIQISEDGNNWNEDFTKRKLAPLSVIDTAAEGA